MTKTQYKNVVKRIEKHMMKIAKERDELDNFIDEITMLKDSCEETYDNLQFARDSMSQFV